MILVFGSTGQVGEELKKFKNVVCLDKNSANLQFPSRCAEIIRKLKPNAVINAAAYTNVNNAENEENIAMLINKEAPKSMSECCSKLDIPFLSFSSDYVFDGTKTLPWKITDPARPLGAYGRTKLSGEQAVLSTHSNSVILRTSWIFSSHGNNFVKTMLKLSETNKEINVVSDQIGGPTSAKSIANASIKIINHLIKKRGKPGVYHFAGQPNVSWANFSREIFKQASKNIKVLSIPSSQFYSNCIRPLNSKLDCTTIRDTFNLSRPNWKCDLHKVLIELEAI